MPCLKLAAAKSAGLGIVVASSLLKLPIFRNVFKAKSTVGLSPSSLFFETLAFIANGTQSFIMNHPFSTWGEVLIISLQNIALFGLMGYFGNLKPFIVVAIISALVAFLAACLMVPPESAHLLVAFAAMVILTSRLPQIIANYQSKSTGVLSRITVALQLIGLIVRLLTVIVETGDKAKITMNLMGLCLNGTIMLQILIYSENTARLLDQAQVKKKG